MSIFESIKNARREKKRKWYFDNNAIIAAIEDGAVEKGILTHDEILSMIAKDVVMGAIGILISTKSTEEFCYGAEESFTEYGIFGSEKYGPHDHYYNGIDGDFRHFKNILCMDDITYSQYFYEIPRNYPAFRDCTIDNIVENYVTLKLISAEIQDYLKDYNDAGITIKFSNYLQPTLENIKIIIRALWESVLTLNSGKPVWDAFLGLIDRNGNRHYGINGDGRFGTAWERFPHFDYVRDYGSKHDEILPIYTGYIKDYVPYLVEKYGDPSKWKNHEEFQIVSYDDFNRYVTKFQEQHPNYFDPHIFSYHYRNRNNE